jgi:hypothetical protein
MVRIYERRRKQMKSVISNVLYRNTALPKDERMGAKNEVVRMLDDWIAEADR